MPQASSASKTAARAGYDPRDIADKSTIEQVVDHVKLARDVKTHLIDPANKLKSRFKQIQDAAKAIVDEYERPEIVVKLSFKLATEALSKILGPVSSHPYLKYHQVHIEALAAVAKALSAGQSAMKQRSQAMDIAAKVRDEAQSVLSTYRKNDKKFAAFKESMKPALLGAFLLRGMVESDVKRKKMSPATFKGIFDVAKVAMSAHREAGAATDELFSFYVALHQSLGLCIGLQVQAERTLDKMRKEKGNFGAVSRSFAELSTLNSVVEMYDLEDEADLDEIDKPIRAAIADVESVTQDWIDADTKFIGEMFQLDVFAAFRNN